jgi:hypothetical protein
MGTRDCIVQTIQSPFNSKSESLRRKKQDKERLNRWPVQRVTEIWTGPWSVSVGVVLVTVVWVLRAVHADESVNYPIPNKADVLL